jgi:tellurite resistance protein TerC
LVDVPPLAWLGFFGLVAAILAIDLGYFHRRAHTATIREASFWAGLWIAVGLAFSLVVYWIYSEGVSAEHGVEATQLYLTAYILEESLSVDNLFVFIVIFRYFGVAGQHQHRVLFYGIMGAILMRGLFIFAGVAALHAFGGTIYILAGLLLFTAARMTFGGEHEIDPSQSRVYRLVRRLMPMSEKPHDGEFFHRKNGRLHATTLFLCLVLIELTDVLFALDSVPAVLGVTDETFIVYTSNILAIVGLRSLYFVVAAGLRGLIYLKPALVVLLAFIGVKMILSGPWSHFYDMPVSVSLGVVGAILGLAIVFSVRRNRLHPRARSDEGEGGDSEPSAP